MGLSARKTFQHPLRRAASRRIRQAQSWIDLGAASGLDAGLRQLVMTGNNANISAEARRATYRRLWREAATEVGAECRELGSGFLEIRRDGAMTRVHEATVMLESAIARVLALDKTLTLRLLREAGVPTPDSVALLRGEYRLAEGLLDDAPHGCAVKCAFGTAGGDGVTCGVRSRKELRLAARRSSLWDDRILVERMYAGSVHRMLFLDGELIDVVRRQPPSVSGDGRSSIAELIRAENNRRFAAGGDEGLLLLRIDLDCALAIRHGGRTLSTVPAAGEVVVVKTATNESAAREGETVRGPVAPEVVDEASRAARAIGVRLAGVDVVAPDLGRPLAESGGVILEVNGTPGLHHHYHVAEPERATRVAVPILSALLAAAS
jgi:D-alanine-D-alanine ligase-like ATP-grasp enzyme